MCLLTLIPKMNVYVERKVSHCSLTFCMINKVCIMFVHIYNRSHTACFDRIHGIWQATTLLDSLLSIINAPLLNTEAVCLILVTEWPSTMITGP